MSQKNKLQKFAEIKTFDNFFEYPYQQILKGFHLKGKWAELFFKNNNPIVLELGCGKGEYTTGLAQRYPEKNFIGMDIKGARIWRGIKTTEEKKLNNVAFIRDRINLVNHYFGKDEIAEIWITFPDPHARDTQARKRLTSPEFLSKYTGFLRKDATINLKTDNFIVFESTLDTIEEYNHKLLYQTNDIYNQGLDNELTKIQTFYEKKWLEHGTKIKYLKFSLNPNIFKD